MARDPKAGDTRKNQGRWEIFDPDLGQEGQFTTVGTEDLEKAKWYLNRLIETVTGEEYNGV